MNAIGIIFSNIHDNVLGELTKTRTFGAVPFGGRYRLIDFTLSNMTNSGINNVGVVARSNYHSLIGHLGSGKEWDLSRKFGGLTIYPPYSTKEDTVLYRGRLEALKNVYHYIQKAREDYVLLSDCDVICNIDFTEVLKYHEEKKADITAVYHKVDMDSHSGQNSVTYKVDSEGNAKTYVGKYLSGVQNLSMSVWLMKKDLLLEIVDDAVATGLQSFERDILAPNPSGLKIVGYHFEGYSKHIISMEDFHRANMDLLNKDVRGELFNKERPIYTNVFDAPPVKYEKGSVVKNSLIANGAVIMGTVENSVIGRDVYISRGAVVKNSFIMKGVVVGEGSVVNNSIIDKKSVIRPNSIISGSEQYPFVAVKNSMI